MKDPRVSIIILNWNGWEDTIECLESLRKLEYNAYDVVVVDNDSKDESIKKIKEYVQSKTIPSSTKIFEYCEKESSSARTDDGYKKLAPNTKIIIIKNHKNHGFGEGNNIAIRFALGALEPDYILLLNNDTVVAPDFLKELVKAGETDKKIGFVGPKTYFYDYNGRKDVINFAGGKISMWRAKSEHIGVNEIDNGQHNTIVDVDYVEGSCMLVRKELIEKIGLIDPEYFAYWEESDWCVRGRKTGYRLVYAPRSRIWHKVSGTSKKLSGFREYMLAKNRLRFIRKNATKKECFLFLLYFLGYDLWHSSAYYLIINKDFPIFQQFLKGTIEGLQNAINQGP